MALALTNSGTPAVAAASASTSVGVIREPRISCRNAPDQRWSPIPTPPRPTQASTPVRVCGSTPQVSGIPVVLVIGPDLPAHQPDDGVAGAAQGVNEG